MSGGVSPSEEICDKTGDCTDEEDTKIVQTSLISINSVLLEHWYPLHRGFGKYVFSNKESYEVLRSEPESEPPREKS